ncbi:MAG: integration host factor subunit beta [SAR324 cluster bacterium]|nr:integration host factor subunit beta [SAR324 cluster bacterium]
MKLNKSTLIERLVEEMNSFTDIEISTKTKTETARETVNLFFNSIKESLAAGDRVEIRGFGSFNVKEYEGYTGRNPKTGVKVEVQPKKLPVFRAGRELKTMVDGNKQN